MEGLLSTGPTPSSFKSMIFNLIPCLRTHPIADLDFPVVTVCPPRGSHTALSYDLMKADNKSLTKVERSSLKDTVDQIFIEKPHRDYIESMVSVASSNEKVIFDGFQSMPRPYGKNGYLTKMWNHNGTFQTPYYGTEYQEGSYRVAKHHLMILEVPKNLAEYIGRGSLVIQLDVDTREEEGWQEEVAYWEGPQYKLFTEKKSWSDAEAHCQEEGGHLASAVSEEVREELVSLASGERYVWIGGKYLNDERVWQWADGSGWDYTNWDNVYDKKKNNDKMCTCFNSETLKKYQCINRNPFICQTAPKIIKGKTNLTF